MLKLRRKAESRAAGAIQAAHIEPELPLEIARRAFAERLSTIRGVDTAEIDALAAGDRGATQIAERLIAAKAAKADDPVELVATAFGFELADLSSFEPDHNAAALIDEATARRHHIVPLGLDGDELVVAVDDPTAVALQSLLEGIRIPSVFVLLAPQADIDHAINLTYRSIAKVGEYVSRFSESEQTARPATPAQTAEAAIIIDLEDQAPIVQVVSRIVTQALRDRASDVHIEPQNNDLRVRFRIDGTLKEVLRLPATMAAPLVSRIKILADMNIVEKRRPQDGQFQMTIDESDLDVRVSTTSTIFGEKAVLRLLDKRRTLLRLADLGMPAAMGKRFSTIARAPYGMVVVCGPTGSGKTTTLYATLSEIARDDINVTTIEDPVEYVFPGINQIQIQEQAGLTFATGLRSILRQDPDVILVGEMRDAETARIAVQSALTGHFVLSTVHATDTVSALFRLVEMGIERFLVSSSLAAVLSQRLVRKVCLHCREAGPARPEELAYYQIVRPGAKRTRFAKAKGCSYCAFTGYRERVGVYELLEIDETISRLLVEGGSPEEVRKQASANGLKTLLDGAMDLVDSGATTIEEVMRSVYTA